MKKFHFSIASHFILFKFCQTNNFLFYFFHNFLYYRISFFEKNAINRQVSELPLLSVI